MSIRPARVPSYLTLGVVACVALTLTACAAAKRDFDLNDGEVTTDAGDDATIADVFAPEALGTGGEPTEWTYEIQEADALEIAFFTHPEQNRFVTVRPDGKISLPYVGDISAVGLHPQELAQQLQQAYSAVLVQPRVDVIVQEMGAYYYVMGEVVKPGEFKFERRLDLMQAMARAGGSTRDGRLTSIVLLRKTPDGRGAAAIFDFREFMGSSGKRGNIEIKPYDIVWVPRSLLSRWDDTSAKMFDGVMKAQSVFIQGWSLVNFTDVFFNQRR